jgi:DNA-directed RNA polymerase specialized sigma24 family protein
VIGGQPVSTSRLPDPSRWVDNYGDYLFRHAVLRLRHGEPAEDVVQETFLAALQQRAGGQNGP